MSSIAYLASMNDKMNKVLETLCSSQDLCKLLYYNDSNPLSQSDITDVYKLIFRTEYQTYNKIFSIPKYPNAEKEKGSLLYVTFPTIGNYSINKGFRKIQLRFDVVCHLDVWCIDSAVRPFSIMNQIDKLFNNKRVIDMSYNKVQPSFISIVEYADYFYGYALNYTLSDNSNVL